jgi:hypothetical protein
VPRTNVAPGTGAPGGALALRVQLQRAVAIEGPEGVHLGWRRRVAQRARSTRTTWRGGTSTDALPSGGKTRLVVVPMRAAHGVSWDLATTTEVSTAHSNRSFLAGEIVKPLAGGGLLLWRYVRSSIVSIENGMLLRGCRARVSSEGASRFTRAAACW